MSYAAEDLPKIIAAIVALGEAKRIVRVSRGGWDDRIWAGGHYHSQDD